jgi:L-iditol 2-dehydrogenase
LRYEDIEVPEFGPEEALCRVGGCGICGSDLRLIDGVFGGVFPPTLPFIIGHEWFGQVVGTGKDVEGLRIGQMVVGEVQKGCGKCTRCMEGRYHLCMKAPFADKGYKLYGLNTMGAYAEYIVVDGRCLIPMPKTFGVEEGVSALNVGIGVHSVRRGKIDVGDTVVVIGIGLLGLLILQIARIAGAGRTIGVGKGYRLQLAKNLGADVGVDRSEGDIVDQIRMLTSGIGADVVFESAGSEEAVRLALDCVRKGGRVVISGISGQRVSIDTDRVCQEEIEVVGSRGAPNAILESIKLLDSRRVDVKPLVTHKFPLSEFEKGIEIFRRRLENVIRVALIP